MNVTINTESNNICAAPCEVLNLCITADVSSYTPTFGTWTSNLIGYSFKVFDKFPINKSDIASGSTISSTTLAADFSVICADIEATEDKIYGVTWQFNEDGEEKCWFYPIRVTVRAAIPIEPLFKQNDNEVRIPCVEDGPITLCYPVGDGCSISPPTQTSFVENANAFVTIVGTTATMLVTGLVDANAFLAAIDCGGLADIRFSYGSPAKGKRWLIMNEHITSSTVAGNTAELIFDFLESDICPDLNSGTGGQGNGAGSSNTVGYNNYDDINGTFPMLDVTTITVTCFKANIEIGVPIKPITDCDVLEYDENLGTVTVRPVVGECCIKLLIEGESELIGCDADEIDFDYEFNLISTGTNNLLYEFSYNLVNAEEVCIWINGQLFTSTMASETFEVVIGALQTEIEVCIYAQRTLCGYYGTITLPINNTSPAATIDLTKEPLEKPNICILPICDKYNTGNDVTTEFCFETVKCTFLPCGYLKECDAEIDCQKCYINPYAEGKKIYFQTQFLDYYSEDPLNPEGGINEFLFFELYDAGCNLISDDITLYGQWMVGVANGNPYQIFCIDTDLMPVECWSIKMFVKNKEGEVTGESCTGVFAPNKDCIKYVELRSEHNKYDCCGNWYGSPDTYLGEELIFDNTICIQGDIKDTGGSIGKTKYANKLISATSTDIFEMYMGCIDHCTHNYIKKMILMGDKITVNNIELEVGDTTFNNNLSGRMFNYNITFTTECVEDNQC